MKFKCFGSLLGLLFLVLPFNSIFPQHPIVKIDSLSVDSTVAFHLDSLDYLYGLDGDDNPDHPYYTFLWIFGDGTFINGTRDSSLTHEYVKWGKQRYHIGGVNEADVTVYSVGSYSGGTRPPRAPDTEFSPPGSLYRSPTILERTFKVPALGTVPDATSLPFTVFDAGDTSLLRLQMNSNVRPQDTIVSIISFRQPAKVPTFPIDGQLFLFYNSKVNTEPSTVKDAASGLIKNTPPTPSAVSLSHGVTEFSESLIHFTDTGESGVVSLSGTGVNEFKNVAVYDFNSLVPDGQDERHIFVEMVNDEIMWELFKDGREDELRFLAVMVVSNPDATPNLPNAADGYLEANGIQNLLLGNEFVNGSFFPITSGPQPKIVAYDEVISPVVSAHDPNNLTLYACECPANSGAERQVIGVIDFSNDGTGDATGLTVTLNVPEQINLNSVDDISITPTPASPVAPALDPATRTVTWDWPGLLLPAETAGYGHPDTKGQVVFTANLKSGMAVSDLDPMDACIVFGVNTPMCTVQVPADSIITAYEEISRNPDAELLECQQCPEYPLEADDIDWLCILLWAIGLMLLVIVVWLVRRFLS